jgi:hypothetical protein
MANEQHLEILRRGVTAWSAWRNNNPLEALDLTHADLTRADLTNADLSRADLTHADLSGANLTHADLTRADLTNAGLSRADLSGATLTEANLTVADLSGANLTAAELSWAILNGANLTEANLTGAALFWANFCTADLTGASMAYSHVGDTLFVDVDLSEVRGLESVLPASPSTVGIDTLAKSRGQLPEDFLRACGLQRWEILHAKLYDPALTAAEFAEIQSHIFVERQRGVVGIGGVFISYSHADAKFVDKLYERLGSEGIPAFLDRHDLISGPMQKQITKAIRLADVVVLVLSAASLKSDWVENELDLTLLKETEEKRDVLYPVSLDESWKAKVADADEPARVLWRRVPEKNILNFSVWETDAFEREFDKLLQGFLQYSKPKQH